MTAERVFFDSILANITSYREGDWTAEKVIDLIENLAHLGAADGLANDQRTTMEGHFCWKVRHPEAGHFIIPRSNPDRYEQAADLLFDTEDEAVAWRDEEIEEAEDDDDELAYIRAWRLCYASICEIQTDDEVEVS